MTVDRRFVHEWRAVRTEWEDTDDTLRALRAKYDELPVLRIWQAAWYLDVDQSLLRRLKARGEITATRDAAGHVVYQTRDIAALAQRRERPRTRPRQVVTHA